MFDILFLGTGASVPSRNYSTAAVMVRRADDSILLDCGEGTQRQIMISPFSFMRISAIFITHLHGDHFYGLPGLLQTMSLMGRRDPIIVRGPEGLSKALETALSICPCEMGYEVDAADMAPGETVKVGELEVTSFETCHGITSEGFLIREPDVRGNIDPDKASSLGITSHDDYKRLIDGEVVNGVRLEDVSSEPKKGKTVAYTGDTRRCESVDEAVRGVDVLIHESTFMEHEVELAEKFNHSTALSAAHTAFDSGCGALFLVHISNRYKDREEVRAEARRIFRNTYVPADLDLYHVTLKGIKSA